MMGFIVMTIVMTWAFTSILIRAEGEIYHNKTRGIKMEMKEKNLQVHVPYLETKIEKVVKTIGVYNRLLLHLLCKCYMRLESLVTSKPKNLIKRLEYLGITQLKVDDEETRVTVYLWKKGEREMLIFADESEYIHVLLPDKELLVTMPLSFVCSYYP